MFNFLNSFKSSKQAIFVLSALLFFVLIFCFLNILSAKIDNDFVSAQYQCRTMNGACGVSGGGGSPCELSCPMLSCEPIWGGEAGASDIMGWGNCTTVNYCACTSYSTCSGYDFACPGGEEGTTGTAGSATSCKACYGGANCSQYICNPLNSCGNPCVGGTNCQTNLCANGNISASPRSRQCSQAADCQQGTMSCEGDKTQLCFTNCTSGTCIEESKSCIIFEDCSKMGSCESQGLKCTTSSTSGSGGSDQTLGAGADWMNIYWNCGTCQGGTCRLQDKEQLFLHCPAQDSEIDQGCINGLDCVWTVHMPGQCATQGNCGQSCVDGQCGSSAGSCGTAYNPQTGERPPECIAGGNAQNTCVPMPGQCAVGQVTIECTRCEGGIGGTEDNTGPPQCNSSYQCVPNGGGAGCATSDDCKKGGGGPGPSPLPKKCNTTTFQCVPCDSSNADCKDGKGCVSDTDCLFKYQEFPTQCDKNKMCSPLGGGKDCKSDEDCQEPIPTRCAIKTLQCVPGGETNKSCAVNSDCPSGACSKDSGKCYGDICESDDDCQPHCNGKLCDPTLKSGKVCETNADCAYKCGVVGQDYTCSQNNTGRVCDSENNGQDCWNSCNPMGQCVPGDHGGKTCMDLTDCGKLSPFICEGVSCIENTKQIISDRPCTSSGNLPIYTTDVCASKCTPELKCDPYGKGAVCKNPADCNWKCDPENQRCVQGLGNQTGYVDCDPANNSADCRYGCNSKRQCVKEIDGGNGRSCSVENQDEDCTYKCTNQQCVQGGTGRLCNTDNGDSDCELRCNAAATSCVQGRDRGGIGAVCSANNDCVSRCTSNNRCVVGGKDASGNFGKICNLSRGDLDCVPICNMSGQCSGNTWLPVAGNWNGGGKTTIGIYDVSTGIFKTRNSNDEGPADEVLKPNFFPIIGKNDAVLNPAFATYDPYAPYKPAYVGVYNYNDASFSVNVTEFTDPSRPNSTYNTNGMAGNTPVESNWQPIVGNWHREGFPIKLSFGLYDPDTSNFYMYDTTIGHFASGQSYYDFQFDYSFGYGEPNKGWIPITGDWDGNGSITVGLYDPVTSMFYLKNDNNSIKPYADITFGFGAPNSGFIPISGDWEKDGKTSVGLYDPVTSVYYLRYTNETGLADLSFGFERPTYCSASQCPITPAILEGINGSGIVSGDWNGDGSDSIGFYETGTDSFNQITSLLKIKNTISQTTQDASNQLFVKPEVSSMLESVMGDWNQDGKTEMGAFEPKAGMFYLADFSALFPSYTSFKFTDAVGSGSSMGWTKEWGGGWRPISGDWDGSWSGHDGSITTGLYYQSWPYTEANGTYHNLPYVSKFYLKNSNTDGPADIVFDFGGAEAANPDWYPVAGDFDGDGITTVGVYDSVNAVLHLKNDNSTSDAETTISYLSLETADGTISGVGRVPLAGDWNGKKSVSGHNIDTVGLSTSSGSVFYYKNTFISDSLPGNLVPQQMTQCQCLPYQCNENFQCVMGGGGPNCDPTNNGSECGQCDLSTFRCTTNVKSGVFCSEDADCSWRCDSTLAKCDMTAGTGPACAGDADCSIKCDDASQKCIPGGTGKDCTLDSQCEVRCSSTTHKCEQGADGISCTKDSECGHLECPENKVCTFTTVPGDDKCSQVNAECCAPYSGRNCNTCANQFCGTNGLWGICPATHEEPNTNGDCVCVIGPATGDPICNTPKTSASNLKASTQQCAEDLGITQGQSAIFFSWNYASNSTDFPVGKYTLQIARSIDQTFEHPVLSKTITIGTNGIGYSATQVNVKFGNDVPDCEEDYWGTTKCYLKYGQAYYWRVQVMTQYSTAKSDWWYYNGTAGGTTTQTQATLYQMPYLPGPYVAVTYSPQNPKPKIGETVTFTDLSKCYSSTYVVGSPVPLCKTILPDSSYTWTGATKTGIPGEATQTFSSAFAPSISLTICQPDGAPGTGQICCSASTPVSIDSNGDVNLPTWKETSPF